MLHSCSVNVQHESHQEGAQYNRAAKVDICGIQFRFGARSHDTVEASRRTMQMHMKIANDPSGPPIWADDQTQHSLGCYSFILFYDRSRGEIVTKDN